MKKIVARCILILILAVSIFAAADCTAPSILPPEPTQATIPPITTRPPPATSNPNDNNIALALDTAIPSKDYVYTLKYLQENGCVLDEKTIDDLKYAPMHSSWISPESKSASMSAGNNLEQYIVIHNGFDETMTYFINITGDLVKYVVVDGENPTDLKPFETRAFLIKLSLPFNGVKKGNFSFVTNLENLTDTANIKALYGTTFYINVK